MFSASSRKRTNTKVVSRTKKEELCGLLLPNVIAEWVSTTGEGVKIAVVVLEEESAEVPGSPICRVGLSRVQTTTYKRRPESEQTCAVVKFHPFNPFSHITHSLFINKQQKSVGMAKLGRLLIALLFFCCALLMLPGTSSLAM